MTETICADEGGTDPFVLPARQHPVNRPDPAMVRILDEQGRLTTHPDFPVDLVDDDLVKALEMMVMTRRFDVEATALQRHGELGLWPPLLGQEATQAGAWLALREGDQVFPTKLGFEAVRDAEDTTEGPDVLPHEDNTIVGCQSIG